MSTGCALRGDLLGERRCSGERLCARSPAGEPSRGEWCGELLSGHSAP